ncbi:hypothetical protein N0V90_004167 [Kalmusia sp. IMI 367209]|nr:hypothetical protein N0V90_004167 [Kalmusia sp. IMI 367209]
MAASREFLLHQYYHVALPRDVPGKEDRKLSCRVEAALLDRIIGAVKAVAPYAPLPNQSLVDNIRLTLVTTKALNVDGKVDKNLLAKEINELDGKHALILYVTEQNAALLIYKDSGGSGDGPLIFEAFEASAVSEKILAATSALQWDFPGRAVSIPSTVYRARCFQDSLAAFIEQASIESVKQFAAVTYKAAAPMPEIRDTTDPSLITGLLMTILEANGAKVDVPLLQKRVRDTVCFKDAFKPWIRSPFYLVIRVATQRHLYKIMGPNIGYLYYKIIMALFVSHLLNDCYDSIPHEASFFLMQKLGRRLAKIEQHISCNQDVLFSNLRDKFKKILGNAKAFLERQWKLYQERTRRVIRPLQRYVNTPELTLQLPFSGQMLNQIAFGGPWGLPTQALQPIQLLEQYESSGARTKPFSAIADRYIKLASKVEENITPVKAMSFDRKTWEIHCCSLARTIMSYTSITGNSFDGYPELKSLFLLDVMELWAEMDRHATVGFPLLKSYHPGFDADILDSLEILHLKDMKRVQDVQDYIRHRCRGWIGSGSKTIFDSPKEDSFAVVFYDSFGDSIGLKDIRKQIQAEAARARKAKEEEWRKLSQQHEQLMKQIAESTCPYVYEEQPDGTFERVHKKGCEKHRYKWEAKQIKIKVFEEPLQEYEPAAKAAVFEIRCPQPFAAYRDATWLLLATFGHPPVQPCENVPILRFYSGVSHYIKPMKTQVTLGSKTKSHLDCHYSESGFPVALHLICRPCGLKLDYYDTVSQSWTKREERASFSRHTPLMLSPSSPYQRVGISNGRWPSSNDIIASQTKCPSDLNVHEFMAWQGLLSGKHSRWLSLLRELGATNLNFSTESTWAIISKLVLQVGSSSLENTLRDIHAVFDDETFCEKLLEQAHHRLEAIHRNWREPVQMDILISLALKTMSLSPSKKIQDKASKLLDQARMTTWDWCAALQSNSMSISRESTLFTIWASVLCKRTVQHQVEPIVNIDSASFECLISASILLQENLVGPFDGLPHALRNLVLQDILFAFRNRSTLANLVIMHQEAFLLALDRICPLLSHCSGNTPHVRIVPQTQWVEVSVKPQQRQLPYFVHFHLVRGDLLINGTQSGILPTEYHHATIEKLFGTHALKVRPSPEPGMSLFIAHPAPFGHWIHLGFRRGQLVVRAVQGSTTLELINPSIFSGRVGKDTQYDLPWALIGDCYHWLDLNSNILEIRQDDVWKSKPSNWRLNLMTRQATKQTSTKTLTKTSTKTSILVDPFCSVAQTIARNFQYFEYAYHIMVTQPQHGPIAVSLKRLELSFFVNCRGLLQCRELVAEIVRTHHQDAGVWYGLHSKIVFRSIKNNHQRMILVPEGPMRFWKANEHITVYVDPVGTYLRFDIDDVLGRIHCPAEHRLLYTKAQWHAYTSHFLPDPLTGRTGSEEALTLLQSGLYKPWAPLPTTVTDILAEIAKLSPRRDYYPTNLKCMETVYWNQALTTAMQDDRYRAIIEQIRERSAQLQLFTCNSSGRLSTEFSPDNSHLESRSLSRSGVIVSRPDLVYISRDRLFDNIKQNRIAIVAGFLAHWSINSTNTKCLAQLLQNHPVIIGLNEPFDRVQIFDLISTDLVENWGALAQTAVQSGPDDRYRLMFVFGPMALSSSTSMDLIQVLISYAILSDLKKIDRPSWPSYISFKINEIPAAKDLAELMAHAHQPLQIASVQKGQMALARIKHEEACKYNCLELARSICAQWCQLEIDVNKLPTIDPKFVDTSSALEPVLSQWKRLAQNFEFSKYLQEVQHVLDDHANTMDTSPHEDVHDGRSNHGVPRYPLWKGIDIPTVRDLLRKTIDLDEVSLKQNHVYTGIFPEFTGQLRQLPNGLLPSADEKRHENTGNGAKRLEQLPHLKDLSCIVDGLQRSGSAVQHKYGLELKQSLDALGQRITQRSPVLAPLDPIALKMEIQKAVTACNDTLHDISRALEADDGRVLWLQLGGLWPKLNKTTLLSELRSTSNSVFGRGAKKALVALGVRITSLQRLLRIQDSSLKDRQQQLQEERVNRGHVNWDPFVQPDWLLLEIDSNIMLRAEQVEVANATMAPASGRNSVVQLLMGKGKTSCILPIVAAMLADKQHLLRIVVPRALLLQSAQVMHIKLGGLLDRELLHIPFSRRTKPDNHLLKTFGQLYSHIKKCGGIMLSLPEHILSFKLSGLQHLCDGNVEQAHTMIKMQQWLDSNARDVLDECDVSLAIRTQLIYPSGSQMAVDGHPLRWQTVQGILRLLRFHIPELERQFPRSIEVVRRPVGDFPLLYLLRRDVEDHVVSRIVDDICQGQLAAVPCAEVPQSSKDDIQVFISSPTVAPQAVSRVNDMFKDKQHVMKILYLLRGLFVHRIFLSTLKKRWNVQYGLHPTRDPIAVPYHAKGVPSPTSEWGHPDVAIILTCLSFYYQGLELKQFKQAFEHLLKSDEPSIEYDKWASKHLPGSLRDYNAINVEDNAQLRELHQHVRFNVYLLDFYLNNFIFPRHAKQFDTKLQASGWDLVLFDPTLKSNSQTTGFSGTNDSRHQLPLTIKQNDLSNLAHTNAEVLSYLLEPRNRHYVRMVDDSGRRLSEEDLLQRLYKSISNAQERIRILIDAGAQILEHDNYSLAKAWLKIDWEATAAVFFDSDHRPWVLYRRGKRIPLLASPFADNLEGCVVYLDESHCRGTDLKLPPNARAALTLGPHVTKDAISQAAMRLRLLGQSQSVTFFSPPEVHQSILDLRRKPEQYQVGPCDVIAWLLQQSCNGIEQLEPLYYNQGNTFIQHEQAKIDRQTNLTNVHQRSEYLSVIRTKESHTLKQMYEPKHLQKGGSTRTTLRNRHLQGFAVELDTRKKNFQDRGIATHSSALEEVEQEREIEHEVENVREPEKPVHFTALNVPPQLHQDIVQFTRSGKIVPGSEAYRPMLFALHRTASGRKYEVLANGKCSGLFVSTQFIRTVKLVEPNDNFLRPCQWILWNLAAGKALVVSPEEADLVLPLLRRFRHNDSSIGRTHLIVYSAPITRRMLHFNNLSYHATPPLPPESKVPTWLKIELGIFSGRLYFEWNEYKELLAYLGVKASVGHEDFLGDLARDTFVKKPLTFLHDWLAVLRKGQDFEHTPMGCVTTGKPLSADHPFFLSSTMDEPEKEAKSSAFSGVHVQDEEENSDGDDGDDEGDDEFLPHEDDRNQGDHEDDEGEFDEAENTFFDAQEIIESDNEEEEEEEEADAGASSGVGA